MPKSPKRNRSDLKLQSIARFEIAERQRIRIGITYISGRRTEQAEAKFDPQVGP